MVKLKLFKSYCTSIGLYDAELWALDSASIETFCIAPYIPSILSDTSPIHDEICKRSMKSIASTLASSSLLIHSIANYCVQCCSPRDFGLGLEAPQGIKKLSWSWS